MPKRIEKIWEPALEDVFQEPMVRLMMQRDGIAEDALRTLIIETSQRLGASTPLAPMVQD